MVFVPNKDVVQTGVDAAYGPWAVREVKKDPKFSCLEEKMAKREPVALKYAPISQAKDGNLLAHRLPISVCFQMSSCWSCRRRRRPHWSRGCTRESGSGTVPGPLYPKAGGAPFGLQNSERSEDDGEAGWRVGSRGR
jgi:hypothetical protein